MTQTLAIRREGGRVVLEGREATKDHRGLLSTILLYPEDALWLAVELVRLVREIERLGAAAGKVMPLARVGDPYPEDRV